LNKRSGVGTNINKQIQLESTTSYVIMRHKPILQFTYGMQNNAQDLQAWEFGIILQCHQLPCCTDKVSESAVVVEVTDAMTLFFAWPPLSGTDPCIDLLLKAWF